MADHALRTEHGIVVNENDALVLEAIRKRVGYAGTINTREITRATGLDNNRANYSLNKLDDAGYINHVGSDDAARCRGSAPKMYVLEDKAEPVFEKLDRLLNAVKLGGDEEDSTKVEEFSKLEKEVERLKMRFEIADREGDVEDELTEVREAINKDELTQEEKKSAEDALRRVEARVNQLENYAVPRIDAILHILRGQYGEEAVDDKVETYKEIHDIPTSE